MVTKKGYLLFILLLFSCFINTGYTQENLPQDAIQEQLIDSLADSQEIPASEKSGTMHQLIKTKFIEGSVWFMSAIALALVIGLSFCLERIIYLNLSQINTRQFLQKIENALCNRDVEAAKDIARNTRGPIASIYYQGLMRIDENIDEIEKSVTSYGRVQSGLLEKNFSWITLFIAMAPSMGFLGTVVGMVQAFDNIQQLSSISPDIVAGGMKVALITTVGGLIVAMILQVFYNYILNKEESILNEMEDAAISLMDMIIKYKSK